MNKKGIFFSLGVVMVLFLLFIIFSNIVQIEKKNKDFRVDRAQYLVVDHFVRDFDRYYVEKILETAAKPALEKFSADIPFNGKFLRSDIVDLMEDGSASVSMPSVYTTDDNVEQALSTLSFEPGTQFSYTLDRVEQLDAKTLMMIFSVDYEVSILDASWKQSGKEVRITMSVEGLYHPTHNQIIDDSWAEDPNNGCYVDSLFSDVGCSSPLNVKPQVTELVVVPP